jgi:outer membrane murein-binding lipoprotein Lpp
MNHQTSTQQSRNRQTLKQSIASCIRILSVLIPTALILTSCSNSDLRAAQKFSELSAELEKLNSEVAQDIYDSCARSATWLAQGSAAGTRQNLRDGLKDCDTLFRPNAVRLEMAGQLLVGYVGAVGQLATEDREAVRTAFSEIGDALKELNVPAATSSFRLNGSDQSFQFNQRTIETGVEIATFITNLLQNDFRRRNLRAAIVCTDQDIQSYATDLSRFIDELYVQALLDDEIDSVTRYFGSYRSPLTDTTNRLLDSGFPEVFTTLQETQRRRDRELREEVSKVVDRKRAASNYVMLIRETATAHADLKRIFNNGKDEVSPEMTAKCNKYFGKASEGKADMKELEREFPNRELSPSELAQVKQVGVTYIEKVSSLLGVR